VSECSHPSVVVVVVVVVVVSMSCVVVLVSHSCCVLCLPAWLLTHRSPPTVNMSRYVQHALLLGCCCCCLCAHRPDKQAIGCLCCCVVVLLCCCVERSGSNARCVLFIDTFLRNAVRVVESQQDSPIDRPHHGKPYVTQHETRKSSHQSCSTERVR